MHGLTTMLLMCLEFCICSRGTSSVSCGYSSNDEGQPIYMESYMDVDPHSIGSPGTFVSQIVNGSGTITVTFNIKKSASEDEFQAAIVAYNWLTNLKNPLNVTINNATKYLNFSAKPNIKNCSVAVAWEFSLLPANYNGYTLSTIAVGRYEKTRSSVFNTTKLEVVACPSPQTVPTVNQNSSFTITANSVGHYNKTANCSCLHDDEVLFDIPGNRAIGTATCAINATWVGCENLQCWSGPKNVTVTQVKMSANAVGPFSCSSDGGFPNPEKEILKLNGKPIPDDYQLKSSDHGKNLSCQVVSPYTKKQLEIFESSPKKVVVYYKPENSTVSDDPAVIPMNSSKLLTYSVYVNPIPNAGGLDVKVYNESGSEASSDVFSRIDNHTDDVSHVFKFNITVRSNNDYGKYKVCASTNDPDGTDCADVSIRNAAVPTTRPDDVGTFSTTIDSRNPLNPGLPDTVIGAIIAGVILLLVLITVTGVCLWKKRNKAPPNEGSEIRERELEKNCVRHELPEDTPGHPRYSFQEFLPPTYETIHPDSGYEAIAEFRPSYELVDSRAGYEMIDIVDSRIAYDDVQIPQSEYDDIIL